MDGTLLQQGATLMLVGMGTVFTFLTLLVVATALMSRLIMKYAPPPAMTSEPDHQELVAVMVAAIRAHRARRS